MPKIWIEHWNMLHSVQENIRKNRRGICLNAHQELWVDEPYYYSSEKEVRVLCTAVCFWCDFRKLYWKKEEFEQWRNVNHTSGMLQQTFNTLTQK